MIFKLDLKKASKLGAKLGAQMSVPLALGLSALGCGKNSGSESLSREQDDEKTFQLEAKDLTVGDQLRSRMTVVFRTIGGATGSRAEMNVLETLDRITAFTDSLDKIEILHREVPYSGRARSNQEWISQDKLQSYFFSTVEQVRAFCKKASGKMESLKIAAGEFEACKLSGVFNMTFRDTATDRIVTKEGSGDRWLANVPFGWIRTKWTAKKDLATEPNIHISQEALSYVRSEVLYPKSGTDAGTRPQGWSLSDCEDGTGVRTGTD